MNSGETDPRQERRRADQAPREGEEWYRSLVEFIPEAVLLSATDGSVFAANPEACRMFGRREAEIRRTGRAGLVDATDPRLPALLEERARSGKVRGELTCVRKDGTRFPAEVSSGLFRDWDGNPRSCLIIRDLTERKQAEERLSQSEQFARATIDALTAHICILDEAGTILAVNESWRVFAQANQLTAQQAGVGVNYLGVCDAATGPDAPMAAAFAAGLRAAMRGAPGEFGLEYPCHSPAEQRWFLGRVTRFAGPGPVRLIVAHENISQRKQTEDALHELSGQLLRSQDEERRRIARELHDTTAQALTALLMNLGLVQESTPGINEKARQLLAGAAALAEQCARELRTLSYLLHPPILDELGLVGAMRDYVHGFAHRSGLQIDLELPPDTEPLPREIELALFRVVQEALTNVRRHSGSRTASIRLARTPTQFRLEIKDQGQGIAAAARAPAGGSLSGTPGVGVASMRERMRLLGGRLEIESDAHGTCVVAFAPVREQSSAQLMLEMNPT